MEPPRVFVCVSGGFQVIITSESLTHLHGEEFIWPLEMKIMRKQVALRRKRGEKDKEKKEWLIAGEGGLQRSVEVVHGRGREWYDQERYVEECRTLLTLL